MRGKRIRKIGREVNFLTESVALMQHLGMGEKYSDIRETLSKKYGNPFEIGLKKFALLEKIEYEAKKVFQKDMEEIRYYFSEADGVDSSCAGTMAILWEDAMDAGFYDTGEYEAYLAGLSEKEYCEKFGKCLQGYHNLIEDAGVIKTEEPYAVISCLMKSDIKDEEKWKLQKIFFDRKEHWEKVLALLKKAAVFLAGFEEEYQWVLEIFGNYWEKTLNERSIMVYLKEMREIDIGESPLGFCLYPSIIKPNVIAFHAEMEKDGTYNTPDFVRIGILFDDDFDIGSSYKKMEDGYADYAAQVLKLIGDKSKFEILTFIRERAAYGSELAKHLNLTTATVSHHMNALLSAGLVEIKRMDTRVYYLSNKKALEEVLDYCKKLLTGKA